MIHTAISFFGQPYCSYHANLFARDSSPMPRHISKRLTGPRGEHVNHSITVDIYDYSKENVIHRRVDLIDYSKASLFITEAIFMIIPKEIESITESIFMIIPKKF
jgi:hypothetical protein